MPDLELKNDTVEHIRILVDDGAGDHVPAPSGDVFNVVSSNPASLQADIGTMANGDPAVVLTPLVRASTGIMVTVSDSAGLKVKEMSVDIVEDLTAVALDLDLAGAETTPQAVPSASGP